MILSEGWSKIFYFWSEKQALQLNSAKPVEFIDSL